MKTELPALPQLRPVRESSSSLPLEHTRISARVTGLTAAVVVNQRFRNPLFERTDLEYLFPLPHEAAVTAFELRVGQRIISATIQEVEQARRLYEDARRQGKRVGLLEGRRPNLFSLQLAGIQPGEFIETVTSYQQRLEYIDGRCEFVYPMGLTPRYHRDGHPDEAVGVDAPLALDPAQVGDVIISIEVETGFSGMMPESPSHAILVSQSTPQAFHVDLDGVYLPDHDFVLRWRQISDQLKIPAWQTGGGSTGFFMATFIPPLSDPAAHSDPREYVFVLDRSGSMRGAPIRQAVNALRACLRTLNSEDTFAILLFDDRLEWLVQPRPVNQAEVENADAHLGQVDGRGGTEIMLALQAALTLKNDPERARLVIFLTDGAVSAETATLKLLRGGMGTVRVFTFGIGPSVNRAFLQQLARVGRGEAGFIGLDEDIEEVILRFQDSIMFPQLTDLSLSVENGRAWDIYPTHLPDLYAGRPLELVGRCSITGESLDPSLPLTLVVTGQCDGQRVEMRVYPTQVGTDTALLPRIWARARVDDLVELSALGLKPQHDARAEIIALALEHSLLSPHTAFLAVDSETQVGGAASQLIHVAHPLPAGLDFDGFTPLVAASSPMPSSPNVLYQMAMSAPLSGTVSEPQTMADMAASGRNSLQSRLLDRLSSKPENLDVPKLLRELARTQQINGSWADSVEHTAAALLAFVRAGQTTDSGFYRKQVMRAFDWLSSCMAQDFPAFLRVLAFQELAAATNRSEHTDTFEQALKDLPAPVGQLESTTFTAISRHELVELPKQITTVNDLRLAVVTTTRNLEIPADLLNMGLARVLAAAVLR